MNDADMKISPEQRQFACVLEIGMRAGLVLLVCGFGVYMSGWLPASVALESLPEFWGLSVNAVFYLSLLMLTRLYVYWLRADRKVD